MQGTVRRRRSSAMSLRTHGDLSWQNALSGFENNQRYISNVQVGRERMSFGVDLPELSPGFGAADSSAAVYGARVRRLSRERDEEEARAVPLVSADGVQGLLGFALTILLALTLLFVWYRDSSDIRAANNRIRRTQTRISRVDREYEQVRLAYEAAAASVDVGYAAVDQGLISGKGAGSTAITIPETALTTPFSATLAQQEELIAASVQR